jgi:hypothetical protein
MKPALQSLSQLILLAAGLLLLRSSRAETILSTFSDFNLDGVFQSWTTATVVSGSNSYSITATGFGSGYKALNPNVDATGETNLELSVTLSGTGPANAPISGPIVSLVDADGTFYNYAWYGQTAGKHVLRANLGAPTFITATGSVAGLDLSKLAFFHLQDDPGTYTGQYTIQFELLRLTGAPGLVITAESYDTTTQQFSLSWSSRTGMTYTVLYTSDLTNAFSALVTDIASTGSNTTTTVTLPTGSSGFLRVAQQ